MKLEMRENWKSSTTKAIFISLLLSLGLAAPLWAGSSLRAENVGTSPYIVSAQSGDVEFIKYVNNAVPQPGEVVTYTIKVSNYGSTDLTQAVISDTLPAGLVQAGSPSINPPGAGVLGALPQLVTNLTVTSATTVTVTLPVMVSSSLAEGIAISNTAVLTATSITIPITASQTIFVGGKTVYLPIIFKPFKGWKVFTSGIANLLYGISCSPDNSQHCVASGQNVTLYTNNAGINWTAVTAGLSGMQLYSVSCPTATRCVAVGKGSSSAGIILVSNNGGQTWSSSFPQSYQMNAVDCPLADQCVTVGLNSQDRYTFNGGQTWIIGNPLGTADLFGMDCVGNRTCWMVGVWGRVIGIYPNPGGPDGIGVIPFKELYPPPTVRTFTAVSCSDSQHCVAVGEQGVIAKTANGWASWTAPNSTTTVGLTDVSCPDALNCYAVGASGTFLASGDGGNTWAKITTPTTQNLQGIDCWDGCYIVGANGTILYYR